jgi:hypothetical protein
MVGGIAAMVITTANLEAAKIKITDSNKRNAQLGAQLAEVKAKRCPPPVAKIKLTSTQTPRCDEPHLKKHLNVILFSVRVLGPDLFRVGNTSYSFNELIDAYSVQQNEAAENGCMYRVELQAAPGVSAHDYVKAEKLFRRQRLIPVPSGSAD